MSRSAVRALSVGVLIAVALFACSKSTDSATAPTNTSGGTTGTGSGSTYNALWIPPTLTGTTFNLTLATSSKQLRSGAATTTYGYNGNQFWGPTLIMNKGDSVTLNVTNTLGEQTTTHWHGFHIPPEMDGGPHQVINAGATWSPTFKIRNNAATYWYHPHLHEQTYNQLTMGAGGLIIIKDPAEAALALPRTYGTDDIPLVFSSRRFLSSNQFAKDIINTSYGDYMLTNGTLNAGTTLPKQVVRLRLLNAEIQRGLNIGLSDNRSFYVITNDGGLLNAPVPVTRVVMMPGERVEVLVDLSKDSVGTGLDLRAFNSGQQFGFPGQEGNPEQPDGSVGRAFTSLLNNTDFNLVHLTVGAPAAAAITTIPPTLVANTYWTLADVTNSRTITVTGGQAGSAFTFDGKGFDHTTVAHTIKLNSVEKWTIVNNNIFGHSIHLHDIQFKIISRSNGPVAPYESGWKDTIYLPLGASAVVVAKFDDFASTTNAYMFHCHFSNHEDEGMMGQFKVVP
ncbi:MAG: multicopper oxidase domain-containing protein [Gemmatimonadaceae bacterium]